MLGALLTGSDELPTEAEYRAGLLDTLQKLNARDTQRTAAAELIAIASTPPTATLPHFFSIYMVQAPFVQLTPS